MAMNVKNVMNSVNDAVRYERRAVAAKKVQEIAEERTTLLIRKSNYESLESEFWANFDIPEERRNAVADSYSILLEKNAERLIAAVNDYVNVV